MFQDEEFEKALSELNEPSLEEYEFFTECMDVKIYRKYSELTGLYEYKVSGYLDCNTELCQQVYMDLEYRKKWDSYVKELYQDSSDDFEFIYWNVNYPFPLTNRDYTYIRECRQFEHNSLPTWVILARSAEVKSVPATSKAIRVNDYKQFLIIQKHPDKQTKAFMHYFDNPGGSIPTWLINWAAKNGVPAFLNDMKNACLGYENYIEEKA